MAHEKSITVSRKTVPGRGKRWLVLDNSGPNKGITLGPRDGFDTMEDANRYAATRSKLGHSRKKKKGKTVYYPDTKR